jgi:hypothetical protein
MSAASSSAHGLLPCKLPTILIQGLLCSLLRRFSTSDRDDADECFARWLQARKELHQIWDHLQEEGWEPIPGNPSSKSFLWFYHHPGIEDVGEEGMNLYSAEEVRLPFGYIVGHC